MKKKSQQATQQNQIQDSQNEIKVEIDFEIKHILTREYSVQYYQKFNLFLVYNEINYHCWNLENNKFQQNLQMNDFLNDDLGNMGIKGPCDSTFLFKSDNQRLRIYDLINFTKINTFIPSQFSNFYQNSYTSQIIRTYNNFIYYYTFQSKYVKKIIIKTKDQFDQFQSGRYLSELYVKNNYYQLRNKSLKIIRNRVNKCKYVVPSQYCYKFLILQQFYSKKLVAIILDKDSMKFKFETQLKQELEDYIYIQEKQMLIILSTKQILIFSSINFGLIHDMRTYHSPKKSINFMSFYRNSLKIFYLAPIDSHHQTIQYI